MRTERRIVVVGVGRVGTRLAELVPRHWALTLVDVEPARVAAAVPDREADRVVGDASSRLVLARCGLHPAATVVLCTGDDAVNAEVARISRDEHGVHDLVSVGHAPIEGVESISRADAVIGVLRQRIGGLVAAPGGGELVSVPVLAGSPAIGRSLREIRRGRWLVAMVYRGGALVVPDGHTRIEAADRVLLAGEPAELESAAAFFRGGAPTFPTGWGAKIGYVDAEAAALWLAGATSVPAVRLPAAILQSDGIARLRDEDVGCLVVTPRPVSLAAKIGLHPDPWAALVRAADVPVLVARGTAAPKRVVVAVAPAGGARTLTTVGLDLARQTSTPLLLLTVLPPTISPDADAAADLTHEAVAYARMHGIEPGRAVETGNPIERIRASVRPDDLLVLGHGAVRRSTWFNPDISQYLLDSLPCSALLVPWTRT